MPKKPAPNTDDTVVLLKHLLAIELWRGGLTQSEIRARLGLGSDIVSGMLKGVSREMIVRTKSGD